MHRPTVIVPCSWGSGDALSPQAVPRQIPDGVQGTKPPEALEILNYNFMNFVDKSHKD